MLKFCYRCGSLVATTRTKITTGRNTVAHAVDGVLVSVREALASRAMMKKND
jgi:hypothetical protein